jgi:hypothetical protein
MSRSSSETTVLVHLPVANVDVTLRAPAGVEDILMLEAGRLDLQLALALLARLSRFDDDSLTPGSLFVTDVDVALLRLRQRLLGDEVSAVEHCRSPKCGARVDITFSIDALLEHHQPAIPDYVTAATERDWYRTSDGLEFRLPRAEDQLAIARAADPEEALVAQCVRGVVAEDALEAVEAAMEAMAPSLCTDLAGTCPECGAAVEAIFDPLHFTLRELRDQASFVYEDVCSIAHHYHWSEAEILALPSARRTRYAELASDRARSVG